MCSIAPTDEEMVPGDYEALGKRTGSSGTTPIVTTTVSVSMEVQYSQLNSRDQVTQVSGSAVTLPMYIGMTHLRT